MLVLPHDRGIGSGLWNRKLKPPTIIPRIQPRLDDPLPLSEDTVGGEFKRLAARTAPQAQPAQP